MSFEFVHASVEKGARGESGFTIAAITRGLPASLEPALAELSAYDFDRNRAIGADRVDWAHRILSVQGKSYTVLSRTAPCGNDGSGRPNRVAHHVVVSAHERAAAGPAWMLANFRGLHEVVPVVGERDSGPELPDGDEPPRPAHAWHAVGFDPGWAGIVAQQLVDHPSAICCVIMPDEIDALPLVGDVVALIPADKRWLITFSTRFQRLPAGGRCQLRFLRAGALGVRAMVAEPGARVVEVKPGVPADDSVAAMAAREGRFIEPSTSAAPRLRVEPVLQSRPAFESSLFRDRDAEFAGERTQPSPSGLQQKVHADSFRFAWDRDATDVPFPRDESESLHSRTEGATHTPPRVDAVLRDAKSAHTTRSYDVLSYALFAYAAVALSIALMLFFS